MFLNRLRIIFQRMERLWRAGINSWNGLIAVTRSEAAFRQELVMLAAAIPLAFLITGQAAMRLLLIGSVVVVLIVELLNTAFEKLSNRITEQPDPAIREVKDIGSAAVGIALLLAATIWLWTLVTRLFS
jgi:diacylglycerol kinase (ATP)